MPRGARPGGGGLLFPSSQPLISDEALDALERALNLRLEGLLQGANHYSMMFGEFGKQVANIVDDFVAQLK